MSVVIKGSSNVNLDFTTGGRITGDFSNATIANRVAFQTSTVNGNTTIHVLPNGTATISVIEANNAADPTNSAGARFSAFGLTDARIDSFARGTGTYLPLTFFTGGSERVRIDTSGNVGIGTSSPTNRLSLKQSADNSAAGLGVKVERSANDSVLFLGYRDNSDSWQINATFNSTGAFKPLTFHTADAERMRLDSSGNLGLGVTPSAWGNGVSLQGAAWALSTTLGFDCTALSTNARQTAYGGTSNWAYRGSASAALYTQQAGSHIWLTAPSGTAGNAISFTQAMSLTAAGNLLVGTTTSYPGFPGIGGNASGVFVEGAGSLFLSRGGGSTALHLNRGTSTGELAAFYYNGAALVGSISITASSTSYNTSSDYRLKNITGPITTSGAYIDSLNPVEGTWKADGSTFVGLIAHEVQEASRTNVATGTKDGEQMQGMDYSSAEIIANMLAELKSLRARVAQLEAK